MDMGKPHGKLPCTKRKTAIWGSFYGHTPNWLAVGVFADPSILDQIDRNLWKSLNTYHSDMKGLVLHWNQILPYIYAIAINDIRISLRSTMKQLELLVYSHTSLKDTAYIKLIKLQRYRNTAAPTITFASVCAMHLNHFDYHRRLIRVLNKELPTFPSTWVVYPPFFPPPDWLSETRRYLQRTEQEVSQSYEELKKIREMVRRGRAACAEVPGLMADC